MASNSSSALSLYQTCPPGLTTSNSTVCDTATCGSIYTTPANRKAKPAADAQCTSCDQGFTGINCNVCSGASSCAARRGSSDSTVICYNQPDAVRTTHIDCHVEQPTIQAVFPGKMVMAMTKVGTPDDFGSTGVASWDAQANTTLVNVFYDGVEQFYCQATNCVAKNSTQSATLGKSRFGTTVTVCDNLKCFCIPGTAMCGGGGLDLSPIIDGLSGQLAMPCDFIDPAATDGSATADCAFQGDLFNNLLGDGGLPLKSCKFGSCITQDQLHEHWHTESASSGGVHADGDKLSDPLIVGLTVLGVAVAALLGLLALGMWRRRKAATRPRSPDASAVGLAWNRIDYSLKPSSRAALSKRSDKRGGGTGTFQNEKAPSAPAHEDGHHMSLRFDDDGGHHPNHILRSVSGWVEPGQMMALLGPSGAGKSTLVDILAGRVKSGRVSGNVAFLGGGGNAIDSTRAIAFVDQDDALPAFSTVREALTMAADLSLPENVEDKARIVDKVINLLGLSMVAEKRIGDHSHRGVSGGERRRVSIGCALVARPRILIADEPLSGLDAFSASRVISAFRNLARGQEPNSTTVIVTIHQPSSEIFHSFDTVMLLAGGRTLFDGHPTESMAWCETQGEPCPSGHNVADHLLKVAFNPERRMRLSSGSSVDGKRRPSYPTVAIGERSGGSSPPAASVPAGTAWTRQAGNVPCTTFMTQLATLSRRAYLTALRDRAGPLAHIVGAVTIGLTVGGCFYQVNDSIAGFQNRVGSMYFLYILLCFAGLSAATTLARERSLMVRERSNGLYSATAWIASFVLFDAVLLRLVPTVMLTTIVYWMVGLKSDVGVFFEFLLITFLFAEAIALLDMTLSAAMEDFSVTILVAGTFILFNIAFGGFLLNLEQIPGVLRWLQWICPLKYSLEAVSTHELKGLKIIDKVAGVSIEASVSTFSGSLFGFKDGAFYRDLLVLALAFNLGFFILLCAIVWWRMRETR